MTFIVTLIALLIERFFDWGHLRQWRWFALLERTVFQRFSGKSSYLLLALIILPVPIIVGLIEVLFYDTLYGFVRLLFDLFIVIYCLGPKNLWADTFASINALTQGDSNFAADKLKTSFGITDITYAQGLHRHLLSNIFVEANRRVFAVIFWFAILGPAGAMLYRLIALSAQDNAKQETPSFMRNARLLESLLDWLPVRILTFFFALGGHFVQVLNCWRKKALQGLSSNETFLTECGMAALAVEDQANLPEDGSAEKAAISLIDRSLVITLVVIAIGELVF